MNALLTNTLRVWDSQLSTDSRTDLPRGTRVAFTRRQKTIEGVVLGREIHSRGRPCVRRVSYDVKFHPAFAPVRVAASKLAVIQEGATS